MIPKLFGLYCRKQRCDHNPLQISEPEVTISIINNIVLSQLTDQI